MNIYRSNRLEALLEALLDVIADGPPSPFMAERIVVQNRGMSTWLTMRLADRRGVWTGGEFPFPRRFLHEMFASVFGDSKDEGLRNLDAFTPDALVWSILAELRHHLDEPIFAEAARYYTDDARGTSRFELCRTIADVFDQYVIFRPDTMLAWERGDGDDWQARLWRALVQARGSDHMAGLAATFVERLQSARARETAQQLPHRICLFGFSSLPPLYIRILQALGEWIPVHLFVLAPCMEHWTDVRSPRERLHDKSPPSDAAEQLPSLLASLGTVARDFQHVLETTADYEEPRSDLFVDPGHKTVLHSLQSGILNLHRPDKPRQVVSDDHSIEFHRCHSPLREVEVLHDRILASFLHDATLQPHDIAVLVPDLDRYAPLIEAVFERDIRDETYIPYTIADRPPNGERPVLEVLIRIAELTGSRVTSSAVLDLLALTPVAMQFGITVTELEIIKTWVEKSGIRWGIDAAHRQSHDQPFVDQNTWRFGLLRMLIGVAVLEDGGTDFAGIVPYDEIEGQTADLLGRFADFCEHIIEHIRGAETPASAPQWQSRWHAIITTMTAENPTTAVDAARIRSALSEVCKRAAVADFSDPVPVETMLDLLQRQLDADHRGQGALAGGINFSALRPMRGVPFRMICILGMSDGEFPRFSPQTSFDFMARSTRPGDRNRRDDDRYLFLEALLSARDQLRLFYVGQSIQDNSVRPPSVVVNDLLEALNDDFCIDDPPDNTARSHSSPISERFIVTHPMQPFSPRGFSDKSDPRIRSFSNTWCESARALAQTGHPLTCPPFVVKPLTATSREGTSLPLRRLLQFYRDPVGDLLKRQLGIYLNDAPRVDIDREPLEADALDDWRLGTLVVDHALGGWPPKRSLAHLRRSGKLPLGAYGDWVHHATWERASALATTVTTLRQSTQAQTRDVDILVSDQRIVGSLHECYGGTQVFHHYAKRRARHLLSAWIQHLVANANPWTPQGVETALVSRGESATIHTIRFRPVPNAQESLADLVRGFLVGQREPLLLFPESSEAFARNYRETHDTSQAVLAAQARWHSNRRIRGESDNPSVARVFRDIDPLIPGFTLFNHPMSGGDFPTIAAKLFDPILDAIEDR